MTPPSFEGGFGHIRYLLRLNIDRVWHTDSTLERAISVGALFDLRGVGAAAAQPINSSIDHTLGRLWFKHGKVYMRVRKRDRNSNNWQTIAFSCLQTNIPKSGYAIGEQIPIYIEIDNRSERGVERVRVQLVQHITYRAARHGARFDFGTGAHNLAHMHTRAEAKIVARVEEALIVQKSSNARYTTQLAVPSIMPTFNTSVPVQVAYKLEASRRRRQLTSKILS